MPNRICPDCGTPQQWEKWRRCTCGYDFGPVVPPLPNRSAQAEPAHAGPLMSARTFYIVLSVLPILSILLICWIIPLFPTWSGMVERQYGPIIPARSYARNLNSPNRDLVRDSLGFLTRRKNPIAVPRAIELLDDPDDYVWLNAALYLGACHRPEATPYLIKALRHTASRCDPETLRDLRVLTDQNFGADFNLWQRWWLDAHPDSKLDWTSHLGFRPRIPEAIK
jgi:hypothetical protein